MLTRKQLKQLRDEITLNSLLIKDYSNSLFIKPQTVCNFFNSFIDYMECSYLNKYKHNASSYNDLFDEYDNLNNLYEYYNYLYEYDALVQDDYIASKAINNSDGIVIYNVNDNYIKVAYYYLSGLYMRNTKIKTLKLHYGIKKDDYYFILDNRRYYLNEFMRVDY